MMPRTGHFRFPGRFEWKVLAAVFIVATLPLGATGYFLSRTLATVATINSRHQQEVRDSLGQALEVYRLTFAQEKETFRARADEISARAPARAADLAGVPALLRARILEGAAVVDEWSVSPTDLHRAREAPPNLVALPNAHPGVPGVPGAPRMLELTFGIDRQLYANFLSLRQAVEKERELDRVLPLLLPGLFRGLILELVLVLIVATAIGLLVARRATSRVATLRDAASRVAGGDLSVRIAPRGRDELDDLGRAFDRMVGELGDARSRLEYLQKVSAWQEVARRLAHEIKNPLTPIQLVVQQLRSQYRGDDSGYRHLLDTAGEVLGEEIGSIRRLVDDFSAFAKLPKVEPTPVDLGSLIDDFARAHPEWNASVEAERPARVVEALCDRMLIRRVLANLVENAIQACEAAGRTARVRLSVAWNAATATATIQVDDNGPGISPSTSSRVFDPYFTTKEHGTGLGLAIVRKIIIDHGGDVSVGVAPQPLGGARFSVQLPTVPTTTKPTPTTTTTIRT
ncbi:MAG: HAMP domain-containing protein [Deltaproteobacteria bacterium]|nr:HAMP domain-containing protein [Deltaproteobacteria bacterium]